MLVHSLTPLTPQQRILRVSGLGAQQARENRLATLDMLPLVRIVSMDMVSRLSNFAVFSAPSVTTRAGTEGKWVRSRGLMTFDISPLGERHGGSTLGSPRHRCPTKADSYRGER